MVSIGLPIWNSKDIVWLAMESLIRQVTSCEWELIVMECKSDNECTEAYFNAYRDSLIKAGCTDIKYIYSLERIPLGVKWKRMAQEASGDIFLLQASDDFSFPERIEATSKLMNGFDWYDTRFAYQYSFAHKKLIEYDGLSLGRDITNFNMAIKTDLLCNIPDSDKRKGIDNFIFTTAGVKTRYLDENKYAGVSTTGRNTISFNRAMYFEKTTAPFCETNKTLETINIPVDIMEKLKTLPAMGRTRISVAMIVRNSDDVLGNCLESVKQADEIVILDTGSTDKTREVALKYTDKYIENEYKWNDNFAEARNYALKYCTGTHILTIDADEVLEKGGIEKLRMYESDAVMVRCVSQDTGEIHYQPRLYRNDPERIFWKGAAHNYITINPDAESDVTITYGTNKQKKNDPDRTMRILKRNAKSPREMYYLAKEYYKRGWFYKAAKLFAKYIKISTFIPEKVDALILMARSLAGLKRYKDATNTALAAVYTNPDCKEALQLVGALSTDENRLYWQQFAQIATDKNVLFVRPDNRIKVTLLSEFDNGASRIVNAVRYQSNDSIDIELLTLNLAYKVGQDCIKSRINSSDVIHWLIPKSKHFAGVKVPNVKYVTVDKPIPHVDFNYIWKPGRKFRILHIALNEQRDKTDMILTAMNSINRKDIDFIAMRDVPVRQKWELLKKCDLYIDSLGVNEYTPLAVDAMSLGIPVIGIGEYPVIKPKPINGEALATLVDQLCDFAELQEISQDAFEYVQKHHGDIGRQWAEIYKN